MKRSIISALAVAASACAFAGGAAADAVPQGGGAVNVVRSSASLDGAFVSHARTQVTQTAGTTVASSNIAAAVASTCTGCDATAVAVQAVVFAGSPRYYTPGNAAVAANSACTGCGSYAYAWQYLVQVDRPFPLEAAAGDRIRAISDAIDQVATSIVPDSIDHDQLLDFELNGLTAQLKSTIDDAVAQAGSRFTAEPIERTERDSR